MHSNLVWSSVLLSILLVMSFIILKDHFQRSFVGFVPNVISLLFPVLYLSQEFKSSMKLIHYFKWFHTV
jgi:hypothetical protein